RPRQPEQRKQHQSQHQPFQPRLVKLTGVAGEIACRLVGEDHRPRPIRPGHPAPQPAIDEIGDAAKEQPDRRAGRHIIHHPDDREPRPPADQRHRQDHPDQPAVKTHAALPKAQHFERFGVERSAPEEQVIDMALRQRAARLADHARHVPISEHNPRQIGQRIEAQGKEPQTDPLFQPQIGPVDRLLYRTGPGGQNIGHCESMGQSMSQSMRQGNMHEIGQHGAQGDDRSHLFLCQTSGAAPVPQPSMNAIRIPNQRAVIDRRALTIAIGEAMEAADGKANIARQPIVDLLRKALADGREEINRRLMERPGAGHDCAEAQAFLIDQLLRVIHDHVISHVYPSVNRTTG
ncbi:hypothetical protein E4T56_gene15251, partial [Termitomyces sp. T112]